MMNLWLGIRVKSEDLNFLYWFFECNVILLLYCTYFYYFDRKRKSFAENDQHGRSLQHRAPMNRAASVVGEHPSVNIDYDR